VKAHGHLNPHHPFSWAHHGARYPRHITSSPSSMNQTNSLRALLNLSVQCTMLRRSGGDDAKGNWPQHHTTAAIIPLSKPLLAASLVVRSGDDTVLVMELMSTTRYYLPCSTNQSDKLESVRRRWCAHSTQDRKSIRIKDKAYLFENTSNNPSIVQSLVHNLGESDEIRSKYGVVFAGMPAGSERTVISNSVKLFLPRISTARS